jgi:hypothetical protein
MEEWFRLACIWETKILEIINSKNYTKKEWNAKIDMVIVSVQ